MKNDLRNLDRKCIYCDAEIDQDCTESCYLNVFTKSVINSPVFIPSPNISKTVGALFAEEIIAYMKVMTQALEEIGFMGRMQALSKDYEDLHKFATSLVDCGHLKDNKEVLEFYKNPQQYEGASRMWTELGKPTGVKSEGWSTYKTFIESAYGQ